MKPQVLLILLALATVAATPDQPSPVLLAQAAIQPAAPAPNPSPPPSAAPKLSAAELEKLVMPIALHPDPLVAIILPASVYPLEIVQAARFLKDTNNIPKIDEQPWDDNVKQLARFPEMIAKMDADLPWTVQLGQAFVDQPQELMDTIQSLRGKAQKAGTLQSTPQQVVTVTNVVVLQTNVTEVVSVTKEVVEVRPSNPEVIYVPTYPPTVYYPPPAYVYNPYAPLITFGAGMAVGAIIANNCDWHHGNVDVDVDRNVNRNVNRNADWNANRTQRTSTSTQKWQPDQNRMRTSGAPSASSKEARGWGSGSTQMAGGSRPSSGTVGTRPSTGTAGTRPSGGTPSANRPTASTRPSPTPTSGRTSRPATPSAGSRSSGGSGSSAFGGMSSGSNTRNYSNRGATSRSGGYSGGRTGGGARGGGRGR